MYITLPNPLPLLVLNKPCVVFQAGADSRLSAKKPEDIRYITHCSAKDNTYIVQIQFSSGDVEHSSKCTDEQQGWLNAYMGAYALSLEGINPTSLEGLDPTMEPWVHEVEIEDPVGSSAWIIQHISSSNPVLRTLAIRAHKKLLALEDQCTAKK